MSHEALCRCPECAAWLERELTILGVIMEPASPAEEREARVQEHATRVVLPSLDGWGK